MDIKDSYEQWEGKEAAIAGRMMFKRVMGKASFCNVQDLKGSIQVYVARDSVGEESYKDFKKMDIGDIVGVKGTAFTTKTGEISIPVSYTHLRYPLRPVRHQERGQTRDRGNPGGEGEKRSLPFHGGFCGTHEHEGSKQANPGKFHQVRRSGYPARNQAPEDGGGAHHAGGKGQGERCV